MIDNTIKLFWDNVEYYRSIQGIQKKDVYRSERFYRGVTFSTMKEIADNLGVDISMLLDEDRDMTLEIAYAMVSDDLKVKQNKLKNFKSVMRKAKDIENIASTMEVD